MKKLEMLKQRIAEKAGLLIAFSGGVDSGLLAKVAYDVLGEKALAVTLDSEILSRSELEHAKKVAVSIDVEQIIVPFSELRNEEFVKNPPNRCYYCKKESAKILKKIAFDNGIECIADGVNLSDFTEHRPGVKACDEEGIWHPFIDVGITKADTRSISKDMGLFFWVKPSSACLASRIPYDGEITKEKLMMIESAEEILKKDGFEQMRVRMHDEVTRIEIVKELKDIGFKYVTLDLEGYRSGSMDEVL